MGLYIIRRTLQMIPILIGVTLITFVLFNLVGGNPAYQFAGKNASAQQIAELEHELGLDRPVHEQYLFYLKQVVTLDFGRSWATRQKISTMLSDGVGASLSLSIPPFILSLLISIGIAIFTSYYRGTLLDRGVLVLCLAGMSISFLAYIIFLQYLLSYKFDIFPTSGYDPSWYGRWQYLVLPWIIWIAVAVGPSILFYRTVIIDEMFQDYVRTARSKGLGSRSVYFRHILKNALIPIITLVALEIPFLFTGSLLLEAFFSIPGIGGILIHALQSSDFPVIKAMVFIGAVIYMIANLISDICYGLVDPRIKLQ